VAPIHFTNRKIVSHLFIKYPIKDMVALATFLFPQDPAMSTISSSEITIRLEDRQLIAVLRRWRAQAYFIKTQSILCGLFGDDTIPA
jgi:hypothetical protein